MYNLKWKFLQIARVLAKPDTLVIIVSALVKSRELKRPRTDVVDPKYLKIL